MLSFSVSDSDLVLTLLDLMAPEKLPIGVKSGPTCKSNK